MSRLRKHEKGQVLLLGIIVLIILLFLVFILFDVQNLVRGKIKAQTAVDSAALVGAEWQKNTLNICGELNLVGAAETLISDAIFGINENPDSFLYADTEEELNLRAARIEASGEVLAQMQYRVLFLCPLIGVGAAQVAAKNNGLNYNSTFAKAVSEQNAMLRGNSGRSYLYEYFKTPDFCRNNLYGFAWHLPYLTMLERILQSTDGSGTGIAVMPCGEMIGTPFVYTDTEPDSNEVQDPEFAEYIRSWDFYDSIAGNDWCALENFLDDIMDYRRKYSRKNWWGRLRVAQEDSFPYESEYLPVHVQISETSLTEYDKLNRDEVIQGIFEERNQEYKPFERNHLPGKLWINPVRYQQWACYKGGEWYDYDEDFKNYWRRFMKSGFKTEAAYHSGAISRMDSIFRPVTFLSVNGGQSVSRNFSGFQGAGGNLNRIRSMESAMTSSPPSVYNYSVAKPFGKLKINGENHTPQTTMFVLPVFTETALQPAALEGTGGNVLAWYDWYMYLLEYVPVLGRVDRLSDMPDELKARYSWYHQMLVRADNEDWQNAGVAWLDTPVEWNWDKQWDESKDVWVKTKKEVVARRRDRCPYRGLCNRCNGQSVYPIGNP